MEGRMKYILLTLCFLTVEIHAAETIKQKIHFQPAKKIGTVQTPLITEASGIVASRKNQSVLWLHNDSGHPARLFAINPEGRLIGTYRINNARCRDWEDIAIGPGPDPNRDYLYIGDIGDNLELRGSITVYRVPEPKVDLTKSFQEGADSIVTEIESEEAESIELAYPDGAKDAETLMVDPLNGDIYIVTKRDILCRVYRAAYPQSAEKPMVMNRIAVLPWAMAVGGDISPDGSLIIIRSLTYASIWERPKDKPLWQAFGSEPRNVELIYEPQGEAICFNADSSGFFTTSEMKNPPMYYYEASDEPTKTEK